ncbi:MAG: hypothetical protein LQ338_001010 [Usnochroma carphineum]|nr:MAG: hypothetical protein LQ338_001010 [Usnochroma carphineum]
MAYFLPSYFQKRILRYALSKLDLLDAEQLNLDNLDIAWGKKSVIELRDVGVQLKKLASLLRLPPRLVLVKASIKLLRVTVPADLYTSGIEAEIEGVQIQLDADTQPDEGPVEKAPKVGKHEVRSACRRTGTSRPRSLRPRIHDPAGEPLGLSHSSHGGDEDSDSAALPTTDDLAKSFLQAEPRQEKAELQAAVAQSQHMDGSDILEDSDRKGTVGVGTGLSLPAFLSGFLRGIEERFRLKLHDVKVDVVLSVDLPPESPSATATSDRSENVILRLSIKDVEYGNVPRPASSTDSKPSQPAESTPLSSTSTIDTRWWVRQIRFSNIHGAVLSDPSIFSSLLPSLAPSSTSEITVAGSPPLARRKARSTDDVLGEQPTHADNLYDSIHLPGPSRAEASAHVSLSGLSQSFSGSDELEISQDMGTTPVRAEPDLIPTFERSTAQLEAIFDASDSDDGDSRSGYKSTYNFQDLPKQNQPEPPISPANILHPSMDGKFSQILSRTATFAEEHALRGSEGHSGSGFPTKSSSLDLQHSPSPRGEDLAESKIFSHEEAESMYMSAMSNIDLAGHSVDRIMPGGWDPQVEDAENEESVSVTNASKVRSQLGPDHGSCESAPAKPRSKGRDVSPSFSSSSAVSNDAADVKKMDAAHLDKTGSISKSNLLRPMPVKMSDTSDSGTEGSLTVSRVFMLIDDMSVGIPHADAEPISPSPQSARTMVTSPYDTKSTQVRFVHPAASNTVEGSFLERSSHEGRRRKDRSPEFDAVGSTTETATSIDIGAVEFKTDMGLARLTALIIKQMSKIFPSHASKKQQDIQTTTVSQAEARMTVDKIAWCFYDRVIGLPAAEGVSANAQAETQGTFVDSELLLKATVQGLESGLQTTASGYRSKVSMTKIAFGYASGNIISFDSNLRMRESTRDILAPANRDLVLAISKDARALKIELTTLPIQVRLDLRRLDETFAWLGGFSSILDLGNSMISTVTTLEPVKSKTGQSHKRSRGVHFESPGPGGSGRASVPSDAMPRKITARVGGLSCVLLGSESSLRLDGSALKAVSRAEGLGVQVDRLNLSGLYFNRAVDQPAIVAQLFNVRMEYLPQPTEVDLARLLALLSPSRDKYEVDDDILLDTLLRQRRQGGVVRLTAERSHNRIVDLNELRHFSTLAEELKKLGTVTKYLPEDDRPGILTLALVRQLRCEVNLGGSLGLIEADLKKIELADITLPSLVALAISSVHLSRNGDEELVAAAMQMEGPEEDSPPMIMARFVGNEMEPTVKVKLYNVCAEYRIPFVLAVMDWSGSPQPEDLLTDMAGSIATLTERERWKYKVHGSPHDAIASSGKSSSTYTALKVDIAIRDCLIGLNPRKSSAKGMVVLTETNFAGTVPGDQETSATLEIRKASIIIIDSQENVKQPEYRADHQSAQPNLSQLQALEAMGYVSVCSMSAARALAQITRDPGSSNHSIDIEIKDDLFVLESCADSTQTLQIILNGLAPPLPASKDMRYRTEVVPIEDMLSSFSGVAFTSDGAKLESGEEGSSSPEDDQDKTDDEDPPDPEMGASFYDLDSSRQYAGVSDSMLDEEPDSVMVNSSAQALKEESSLSASYEERQEEVEGPPLEFQDEHFGTRSSVGGTAHRWNTKHNTYGLSDEPTLRKSPLRVRVRDVHVIWNLFDGYDWQRTRDTIGKAITDVETKALNRQSKRDKRKPQEKDEDEESVIGDFLFNSIYIGIPANKDPRNLSRQVSRNLDDVTSESESSATSAVSSSSSRPSVPSPARNKRPRLARSKHHKMTFELRGISADLVVFPPGSGETQSSIDVRIKDLEIFDHVPTSTWKKFATYMQDAGERESGTSMIHLEILNVRPVPDLAASEIILKATVLPLRLHVDQDALDFMTRFFEFKDDSASEAAIKSEAAFLQRVEVNSVRLRLDFKPKRVDYAGIRSGRTNEFMNFFILDRADMVLRHVIIYGISGFDRLGKTLNDIWMPDIKRNQLPGVLAGLAPVRSLVSVGGGVRDLVVIPIQEYQKDGRIVRSLQKGALAFAKTTTSELVKLGAKLAIGTQTVLQGAEDLLQPEQPRPEAAGGWEEADLDEDEKKRISLYADQPVGVMQGLRGAYASLERDLLTAKDAIVAMPGEVMESGTAGGAAKAVLRGAPIVILRPALGVSKAVGRTLMGATNSLDPENRRRIEEKYKKH